MKTKKIISITIFQIHFQLKIEEEINTPKMLLNITFFRQKNEIKQTSKQKLATMTTKPFWRRRL